MPSAPRLRFAALALLFAAACSDSPVEPRSEPVDLATALDELSLPALTTAGAGFGVALPAAAFTRSGCTYDGTSSFVCTPITANGLTIKNSYTLLTASGATQSAFDAATTDAVRTKSSVVGDLASGTETIHIDDQRTSTLSGLVSGHHVINGNGVTHMTMTGGLYPLDETITTSIVDLLPPLKGGNGYPRGGTVTMTMDDASLPGFPSSSLSVVMVFNGTSKVAVTITGGGLTQHCIMDISSPAGGMSCSG